MNQENMDVHDVTVNQEEDFVGVDWGIADLSGKSLDKELVHKARREEVECMKQLGVFEEGTRQGCVARARRSLSRRSGSTRTKRKVS